MSSTVDRLAFAAPSSVYDRKSEVFMPIRIKYHYKNSTTTQQLEISLVMPEETTFSQVSYTAIKAMFGVLYGSI